MAKQHTNKSQHLLMFRLIRFILGLLLTITLALLAIWLSRLSGFIELGLGALTLAILLGIIIGNTLYSRLHVFCSDGVFFAKQYLLRLGIILYGFRLTFQQVAEVGATGIIIDLLTLSTTFLLACWLGKRLFSLDQHTLMLIGAGSGICGAAAIMATESVLKADASKVAVAIATVVIFGTLSIFVYPWLYQLNQYYQWLPISQGAFGIFAGSTIHEVAQVVAAGQSIGNQAENAAVITKMIRVMMLAPFLLLLSAYLNRQQTSGGKRAKSAITVPWFAVIFILVAGFNSFNLLPVQWVSHIITLDTALLAMAMTALGLTTHISAIKQAGVKPMLLALVLFIWLIIGGLSINLLVQMMID